MIEFDVQTIEQKLSYHFRDEGLLKLAFTHSSYANENACESNERLEFLGDSILNYVVAEYLYETSKKGDEGELTRRRAQLVSAKPLAVLAENLGIGKHLLVGVGEGKSGGKGKLNVNADLVEACIAAIYLDGGMDAAKQFVLAVLPVLISVSKTVSTILHDYKTELQEFLQEKHLPMPQYELVSQTGSSHMPTFSVRVVVGEQSFDVAEGKSKKEAQQNAAKVALNKLKQKF